MKYQDIEPYRKDLIKTILQLFPTCQIYLFGSRATRTNNPHSDIDLAIDCGHVVPLQDLAMLIEAIDRLNIPFCVDIVDIQNTSPVMVEQINKYGILWKQ